MIVPEHWLREFVAFRLPVAQLAHRLTMAGLEVESCAQVAPPLARVVVGEIVATERHPNAERLSVCTVDAGRRRLRVVCGAPNARPGVKAPLALAGATLGETEVRATEVRGVQSEGMLLSARELGVGEDHAGLLELPADARPGTAIGEALALDEHLLAFKLTPNRGDCLSILGIAREVAALTGAKLRAPRIRPVPPAGRAKHPFAIANAEGCGRFTGRVIRNVNAAAPTPEWMRRRLERAGLRSISALVDVTNYVMLELGRPLHVYDLAKLRGTVEVRWGRRGERLVLLNGAEVEVDETVLCIADDSGPIGLAGIMGGDSTKAETTTRDIFLESAFFFPEAIAGRARRYGLASDAAHRFERGVDFANSVAGIERATRLVLEICGGEPGPTVDLVKRLPARRPVRMRIARARKVIGMPIAEREMARAFRRLGLVARRRGDAFVVTPPSWRFDLAIEEDLIEEVARLHGFENIPLHPPRAAATMSEAPEGRRTLHAVRERLAARDYQEVINFAFVEPDWERDFAGEDNPIRLLNPIASQASVLRTTLFGSLIANVRYNHARKLARVRVFEIGRVFLRDASAPDGPLAVAGLRQPVRVAAAAFGPALEEQWASATRPVDFFDVKGDLEALYAPRVPRFEAAPHPALHPGRSARVLAEGSAVGWIGELHPRWQMKYELPQPVVLFEVDAESLLDAPLPRPEHPSRFPPIVRDLAVVVDQAVAAQALLDAAMEVRAPIVRELRLFDVYQGPNLPPGKKSLAFRIVMQHTDRSLTDAEADAAQQALLQQWERRLGARLRA
ncbi:MAG: phenylalanine--tRNA ligase subunit beta [Burkholderiales bacterium]|nr:phenylalanine--tRNA ligase subunit beta [Burkholderiales bacterium]